MLDSGERETEILLGNRQLLAIFFVGAALLGAAFTGGYMLGRRTEAKAAAQQPSAIAQTAEQTPPAASNPLQGGETHSVSPADNTAAAAPPPSEELLGSRKKKSARQLSNATETAASKNDPFSPQAGQEFLQVTALPHDHAVAVAGVLRRKGFRAHAVAKPGEAHLYRVLVGPIRDAGELASTRDSLRKAGFGQVLVQHFQ